VKIYFAFVHRLTRAKMLRENDAKILTSFVDSGRVNKNGIRKLIKLYSKGIK